MEDLISVIMSTYNEEKKWIQESIDSVLEQTYSNFEFIIVLDNPKNSTLKKLLEEYAEKDNRIHIVINKENKGLVKSLNIALKYCHGKYIARMDADDICEKERLMSQKDYLEKNNLDFVFSGVTVINQQSLKVFETSEQELSYLETRKHLECTNISNHPTWFLKAEVYKNLGGYREVLYCEDYDFSLRCLKKGYKIGKMDKNILKYRIRQNSISRSYSLEQFLNATGISKLYKKGELEDFDVVSKLINKSKKQSSDKEKQKYNKADKLFNEAKIFIKKGKKIKCMIKLIKSMFISKYYIRNYLKNLRYKIKVLR